MTTENTVMTPYEVAKELRSSLRFVYKQMKSGVIPHVKVGDKYLIGHRAFDTWVNGGKDMITGNKTTYEEYQ